MSGEERAPSLERPNVSGSQIVHQIVIDIRLGRFGDGSNWHCGDGSNGRFRRH